MNNIYNWICDLGSKKWMPNFIKKWLGFCPQHGWFTYPKRYRMNTAYVNDEQNYSIGCKYCQKESYEYYQDLWNTFYSGCL